MAPLTMICTFESRFGHACNTHYLPHTTDRRLGHAAGTSPQNLSTAAVLYLSETHIIVRVARIVDDVVFFCFFVASQLT